jgi:hypothetical protein
MRGNYHAADRGGMRQLRLGETLTEDTAAMAGSSREWAEENDTDGDQGRGCREKLDGGNESTGRN